MPLHGLLLLSVLLTGAACSNQVSAVSTMSETETGPGAALRPCPSSPNCVCSDPGQGGEKSVEPLPLTAAPDVCWKRLHAVVTGLGGVVITDQNGYLHATFSSRIFRFIDDLEARLDQTEKCIHLRSAARTGYYDFGVNRRRVENIRRLYLLEENGKTDN